jgi:uncharacterized protein YdhG (YjbR/CyaY superfamily)
LEGALFVYGIITLVTEIHDLMECVFIPIEIRLARDIMEKKSNISAIDEYIATFPEDVQKKLWEMRKAIRAAAPDATEKISYQMPTFFLNGNLVHFAAFKNHIGFYPAASGVAHFTTELAAYQTSKGAIQFPLDQPIPFDLVTRIVQFRVMENLQKAQVKAHK